MTLMRDLVGLVSQAGEFLSQNWQFLLGVFGVWQVCWTVYCLVHRAWHGSSANTSAWRLYAAYVLCPLVVLALLLYWGTYLISIGWAKMLGLYICDPTQAIRDEKMGGYHE